MTTPKPAEPAVAPPPANTLRVQTAATAPPPPVKAKPQSPVATVPVSVVVTKMPEEKHDFGADFLTGGIGVLGGLIGAVVGAGVAYRLNLRQAKKLKDAADLERLEYLSFAVVLKLRNIYEAQTSVHRHIKDSLDAYVPENYPSVSMAVSAFGNTPARVNLDPEEVLKVGKFVGNTVLNILLEVDINHNTTMDLIDSYRSQWMDVHSFIQPDGSRPDGGFYHRWTAELDTKLRPRLNALDKLVEVQEMASRRDRQTAYVAIIKITQARLKAFQPDGAYEIEDLDGKTVIITADEVKPAPPRETQERTG